jgi:phosphotransacetylase
MKQHSLDEVDPSRVLTKSIDLLHQREADILFQGDTDIKDFLQAVTNDTNGIAGAESLSYISLFELPSQNRLILLTDTYIHEFPNLQQKMTILNNAISLAGSLGIGTPKVAALSMVELVNPNFISTLDAAVLSKMSERKQINAIVDGPLDIDCASSLERATRKGLKSSVSGEVDIYLFHDIESGYSVTELTVFIGKAQAAGALMGSNIPIILNMSFETVHSLLVDIALALLRTR